LSAVIIEREAKIGWFRSPLKRNVGLLLTLMTQIINRREPLEVTFFIVGGICGAILLFLVGSFALDIYTMDSEQQVSGSLKVSSEWLEIIPDRPLNPSKGSQQLVLQVDEDQVLFEDRFHPDVIRLADGTNINPEIQLVDPDGNIFEATLYRSSRPSRYANAVLGSVSGLDKRNYVKVRVRSDKPLNVSRIIWHCWRGK
jgi:hypothetical protein